MSILCIQYIGHSNKKIKQHKKYKKNSFMCVLIEKILENLIEDVYVYQCYIIYKHLIYIVLKIVQYIYIYIYIYVFNKMFNKEIVIDNI